MPIEPDITAGRLIKTGQARAGCKTPELAFHIVL